jgi:double-stranded uracil-DNA glycosylase
MKRKPPAAPAAGAPVSTTLRGFPPVLDPGVHTLILGSFPSEASLAAGQYYAHPRNQFWRILGNLLQQPLHETPYRQRLAVLLAHGLGLWDVLGACERAGSLDADIRAARANDFAPLRRRAPKLARVLFNGQAAGRFAPQFHQAGLEVAVLPSTSPAHAGMSLEQKLACWRAAFESPVQVPVALMPAPARRRRRLAEKPSAAK